MKKLEYPLHELFTPPFRLADLEKMSKKEARAAFDWFVAESPKRIALLSDAVKRDTGIVLDYSEDSLVPLWEWAVPYFTRRNSPPCGITLEDTRMKPAASNEGLHIVGLCLTIDIGYYLAEVIMRLRSGVQWRLWDRKSYPQNEAILTGTRWPTAPRYIVENRALDVLEGKVDRHMLLDACRKTLASIDAPGE